MITITWQVPFGKSLDSPMNFIWRPLRRFFFDCLDKKAPRPFGKQASPKISNSSWKIIHVHQKMSNYPIPLQYILQTSGKIIVRQLHYLCNLVHYSTDLVIFQFGEQSFVSLTNYMNALERICLLSWCSPVSMCCNQVKIRLIREYNTADPDKVWQCAMYIYTALLNSSFQLSLFFFLISSQQQALDQHFWYLGSIILIRGYQHKWKQWTSNY